MLTQAVTKQNALLPSLFDDFFKTWRDWPMDFNGGRSFPAVTVPAVNVSENSDKRKRPGRMPPVCILMCKKGQTVLYELCCSSFNQ